MVAVDAGWIGPDGLGGAYKNKAEVLQAQAWYALGGTQGVLSGMTLAGVAGSMAIDVAAGAAMVSRRDGSNNVQAKGYLLPVATTTRVTFGAASPSARNDALVAAVVDTSDGAVGTGALSVGGQLVAVPGVSGTSTPRTDAQIAAYLGRGGFVRLADVLIASTDTQINMANVTLPSPYNVRDTGWISIASGVLTGTLRYRILNGIQVYIQVDGAATTASGTALTLTSSPLPSFLRPTTQARAGAYFGGFAGIITVDTSGNVTAIQQTGSAKSSVGGMLTYPLG